MTFDSRDIDANLVRAANERKTLAPQIMMALALIGLAVALYDSYAIYNGLPLWCPPPVDGCNEVAASPYARIRGIPVCYFGLAYYTVMFGLAAALARAPFSGVLRIITVCYSAVGVAFSLYFMAVQFSFIGALCIYCLISAATTVLLALVSVRYLMPRD